jgi:cell division protein FtsZ
MSNKELEPKIVVFGVGGAGCNAVNNMIEAGLEEVNFWVANTDAQSLSKSISPNKIQLGTGATMGLGAGSNPEVGSKAAEESLEQIAKALDGCNMVFITAGMGGGTGTGAAPVIAGYAKSKGILTVGVVTTPFHFEGARRMKVSDAGLAAMSQNIDTIIVIPNQNIFYLADQKTTFAEAFKMADKILESAVRGIVELITRPGAINLDFADIRTVMGEMGKAMMCTGEAEGDNRAIKAAEAAISNPLLDIASMRGAKGVLINITGSYNLTLFEVDEAANRIREEADPNANIIFGSTFDENLGDKIRVSVVATGIDKDSAEDNQEEVMIKIKEHEVIQNKPIMESPRPFLSSVPKPQRVENYQAPIKNNDPIEEKSLEQDKGGFTKVNTSFIKQNPLDIPAILRKMKDNK